MGCPVGDEDGKLVGFGDSTVGEIVCTGPISHRCWYISSTSAQEQYCGSRIQYPFLAIFGRNNL